ncbi:uncharacterized protein [Rutidosis leptorrhynchoides]|uniref:uncharacterized protein n=1 Tax=Rutidosis leptorrhynchoides TaxID=125765 RepID=UPI003A991BD6
MGIETGALLPSALSRKVGNGRSTKFWKDLWLGKNTLAAPYNRLFLLDLDLKYDEKWVWILDDEGSFSVKEPHIYLDNFYFPSSGHASWWFKFIPTKVNVFMWRLHLDRLPSRFNLSRELDLESIVFPICGNRSETRDHTFLSCSVAASL